jgi:hypothetical protein
MSAEKPKKPKEVFTAWNLKNKYIPRPFQPQFVPAADARRPEIVSGMQTRHVAAPPKVKAKYPFRLPERRL